ncbi:hypothetical protein F52700_12221 [Fusarium sp. NRRL 52700]|nr:hypothetical protein F52700_12221 [Fusarium sp. NRRL 52700]
MHLIFPKRILRARPEITRKPSYCQPTNREELYQERDKKSCPKKAGGPVECHIVEPTSPLAQLLRPQPATITAVEAYKRALNSTQACLVTFDFYEGTLDFDRRKL